VVLQATVSAQPVSPCSTQTHMDAIGSCQAACSPCATATADRLKASSTPANQCPLFDDLYDCIPSGPASWLMPASHGW
jgi:hypothetical protein